MPGAGSGAGSAPPLVARLHVSESGKLHPLNEGAGSGNLALDDSDSHTGDRNDEVGVDKVNGTGCIKRRLESNERKANIKKTAQGVGGEHDRGVYTLGVRVPRLHPCTLVPQDPSNELGARLDPSPPQLPVEAHCFATCMLRARKGRRHRAWNPPDSQHGTLE